MDYKKELLLFLYENNSGLVEIYPVSENTSVTNSELKLTITALKKDGLIDTDELFRRIGSGDPSSIETTKSLHIKARITPQGEQYVRDTYMKKNETNTFNVDQLINVSGDNHAPISQTNDHSSSQTINKEIKNVMIPKPNAPKKAFRDNKYVISIVSGIIATTIGYFIIKYLTNL